MTMGRYPLIKDGKPVGRYVHLVLTQEEYHKILEGAFASGKSVPDFLTYYSIKAAELILDLKANNR